MDRTPQEKFVTLYDTAKKCLLILDHLYRKIEEGTLLATDASKIESDVSIVIELYVSTLSFVDYLHRFYEIICGMPLLRKDLPELKKLGDAFLPVEECRNYLQHMREDLMANAPLKYPILGAISWIHEQRNYMLLSNQPTQNYDAPGIVYDRLAGTFVCKYQLVVGGHNIQLDTVYGHAKSFWTWLEKRAVIQPDEVKEYAWGKPMIFHAEFRKA